MSPTVPPISTMHDVGAVAVALTMASLISSVTWGITCTVPPR